MFSRRRGQSTLEYALVIACVVAALTLMQHYFKRSMAGRYKTVADDISQGEQFDPAVYRATDIQIRQDSYVNQRTDGASRVSTTRHLQDQRYTKTSRGETITAWGENEDLYSK